MKKKLIAFFIIAALIVAGSMPTFADSSNQVTPGLVTERIVEYEDGTTILIQVYNLDDEGNLPIPQARSARELYRGRAYLDTNKTTDIVTNVATSSYAVEAVTCYNGGNYDNAGAVTFRISIGEEPTTQAVDAGQAVIFRIRTNAGHIYRYTVNAKANWWPDSYYLKVEAE